MALPTGCCGVVPMEACAGADWLLALVAAPGSVADNVLPTWAMSGCVLRGLGMLFTFVGLMLP